ncbi:MAG: hypothetical protein AB8I08_08420 [Sandaracinaceae bacterium]
MFADRFEYEGDRAIVLGVDADLPRAALKPCIIAALRYHEVKRLPQLGLVGG